MDQSRPGDTSYRYLWDGTDRASHIFSYQRPTPARPGWGAASVVTPSAPNASSGIIAAAAQDTVSGNPQTPLGLTRFRVTFPDPGTFPFFCLLHDDLGMKGMVIVFPKVP